MGTTTQQTFEAYQKQYDYFNAKLFEGKLPECFLNFSRKRPNTLGFFAPNRWEQAEMVRHEISINPSTLKMRSRADVASTLVHEMCHLWQQEFGKPSGRGYHNKEWGKKMVAVGLMPSNTGEPGGKKTGVQMTNYVIDGGPFDVCFKAMPEELQLPWLSFDVPGPKKLTNGTRVKYSCPKCQANVWGKAELSITCGSCGMWFQPVSRG